jgi:pimeloyl-ACP methyl ester carboxylesterase
VATFGLVHGAWHGAWCWESLAAELGALGHRAVAVELPSDELDAGCGEYADAVVDALAGEDDPVLVGHSLGGLTLPLVAARRPVRRLVYLCALVPRPGRPPFEREDGEPRTFGDGLAALARDELGRSCWPDAAAAIARLYPDVPPGAARAAAARLRPQAPRLNDERCPLERLPDAETVSILGTDDAVIRPEWSRWTARRRLGVEPVELPGGHSPMLARPAELAQALVSAA